MTYGSGVAVKLKDALQRGGGGGLNLTAMDDKVKDTELRQAENVRLSKTGAFGKRGGTQRIHSSALGSGAIIRGGFSWNRVGSTQQLVVCNALLFTATYAIPATFTQQTGALSATETPGCAAFRDATD